MADGGPGCCIPGGMPGMGIWCGGTWLPGALHTHWHTIRHAQHRAYPVPRHLTGPGNGYVPGAPGLPGLPLPFIGFLPASGCAPDLPFLEGLVTTRTISITITPRTMPEESPEIWGERIEKGAALDREESL